MNRRCRSGLGTLFVITLLSVGPLWAREVLSAPSPAVVVIPRVDHPPKLEDFLQMQPGPNAPRMAKVTNFIERDPKDGAPAQERTEVYIGYDAKNFYAVFVCFDKDPKHIRARMTRREDIGPEHDEVQIYLDTFHDKRRAYGFMINPLGVQFDYIWTEAAGYDASWDTVWESNGRVTPQGYVAWMAIPFKSLRFPSTAEQTWGILFQRVVPHDNDNSFYPHVSSSIQGRLNQEATLRGLEHISPGRNIQLVPYAVTDALRSLDQRDPNNPFFTAKHLGGTAGLDAKLVIKDSLVLDTTFNPDFRQLESDQPQNTVNQRFEVFFPEKRPFFQEGANFFQTPINLYFTRRIQDPEYGARLTGKLGPWGIGVLAADDRGPTQLVPDNDVLHSKRAYFAVAHLTRELWTQSHVGFFFSDRELDAAANTLCTTTALTTSESQSCISNSNRVGGFDFHFRFGEHWFAEGQAVSSTTDQADGTHLAGPSYEFFTDYAARHWELFSRYTETSPGFFTLTGFFRRPDIRHSENFVSYRFRPEGRILTWWGPQFYQQFTFDHAGTRLDYIYEPGFHVVLKANTDLAVFRGFTHEQLRPSDFSALTQNTDFRKGYWQVFLTNTYSKWVTFNALVGGARSINFDPPSGQAPFLADETSAVVNASVHPSRSLSIDNAYILERLLTRTTPAMAAVNSHIIRSKWNYQYNRRLSFRTILQYNGVLSNPAFSSLDRSKNFNTDFLISYLVHPGTALYLGYNTNLENFDPQAIAAHSGLVRTLRSYINDGRTFFVKVSYLLRF